MAFHPADDRWMRLALSLGRRGMGRTWPNPAVGCVIVKNDRVLGRGWTQPGGRPHAETEALAQAASGANGATAYVTLEPCAHHGDTPPCSEALIEAGISRVVSAIEDPDKRVAGRGHATLRKAGINVDVGCQCQEAARNHAGFFSRTTKGRPFITLKLATSFDGRIATKSGESQWITAPPARRLVHLERSLHDAVMVGSGTVIADDPMLNIRGFGATHQPVRVVCDTQLSSQPGNKLGRSAKETPVWICHGPTADRAARQAWENTGAQLLECDIGQDNRLDVARVVEKLAAKGLTRIFVEGGGQLAASLLACGLVDRLMGFTAGLSLGADGLAAIAAMPEAPLAEHQRFTLSDLRQIGPDIVHVWERG